MAQTTTIEWTDTTWNPIRGCSRVSEGCRHCYAERHAHRFSGPGRAYEGLTVLRNGHPGWSGKVNFVEKRLLDPLKLSSMPLHDQTGTPGAGITRGGSRPRRIFVNSMSDLFHETVPDEWIDKIFAVMALCPQHQFQVLTKRPARMLEYFTKFGSSSLEVRGATIGSHFIHLAPKRGPVYEWSGLPMPNVWLGVSVENQAAADERIPLLLQTEAAVRFISAEPLLGPINLKWICWETKGSGGPAYVDVCNGTFCTVGGYGLAGPKLDWVIAGGESGPGARPMGLDWPAQLRDQCQAAGVPFFFKQWGEWAPSDPFIPGQQPPWGTKAFPERGRCYVKMGKKNSRAILGGREWKDFPEVRL